MLLHAKAAKEAVWLRQFLIDLEVVPSANKQITIYCDNSGAVANSKEQEVTREDNRRVYLSPEINDGLMVASDII
ncbi:hypothetical protein Q3G72_027183 [Acer saccharum]|nr:hypothetical protein Q3G72_027183 [Acer saccharum]